MKCSGRFLLAPILSGGGRFTLLADCQLQTRTYLEPRSVLDLLHAIADVFGYWLEPEFFPARPGDIRESHADITLARSLLGYAPVTGFAEGLKETISWLRGKD